MLIAVHMRRLEDGHLSRDLSPSQFKAMRSED